jgi:hypothetical protein
MNTLFRLLTLVAIFALWGQARAYEVVIDINVKQKSALDKTSDGLKLKSEPELSGTAWVSAGGNERQAIALPELDIKAPHTDELDGEEWALEWIAESAPELIQTYGVGLDPDLLVTEIDLRKHKLRCRGRTQVECDGELSIRLSLTRL